MFSAESLAVVVANDRKKAAATDGLLLLKAVPVNTRADRLVSFPVVLEENKSRRFKITTRSNRINMSTGRASNGGGVTGKMAKDK